MEMEMTYYHKKKQVDDNWMRMNEGEHKSRSQQYANHHLHKHMVDERMCTITQNMQLLIDVKMQLSSLKCIN